MNKYQVYQITWEPRYEKEIHAVECEIDGSIKRGTDIYLTTLKQKTPSGRASVKIEVE
jgi:hypothetical protein